MIKLFLLFILAVIPLSTSILLDMLLKVYIKLSLVFAEHHSCQILINPAFYSYRMRLILVHFIMYILGHN